MVDQTSLTSDAYVWVGSSGGLWGSTSNWMDRTTGANPVLFVPSGNNPVTVSVPSGPAYEVIGGGGRAASLNLTGYLALNGQYALGDLALGTVPAANSSLDASIHTGLSLGANSTVSASIVTANNASVSVSGPGAALTASGAVTFGGFRTNTAPGPTSSLSVDAGANVTTQSAVSLLDGSSASVTGNGSKLASAGLLTVSNTRAGANTSASYLTVSAGGFVQATDLILQVAPNSSTLYGVVTVDSTSTLEIGSAGRAAVGTITVDAGRTASMAGVLSLRGAVVNNGTISEASGTLTINGTLSGSGSLQIGRDATLALNGTAAAATTIAFTGTGATLAIGSDYTDNGVTPLNAPYSIAATLTGFAVGDGITLANNVTSASYTATGANMGTLSLLNGTQQVTSLTLSGSYANYSFVVSPNTTFGNTILLLPDAPTPAAELPVISGVSPDTGTSSSDGVTSTGAVTVSGTAQEGSRVELFDGAAQVGTNIASSLGAWSIAPATALSQGAHSLTARATDVAGNLSGASAAFVVTVDLQGLKLLDPLFDRTYYLAQNPDVKAANVDPLLHFDQYGWKEDRDPSLLFSNAKYLAANPDVKAAGVDPLLHYMSFG